MAQLESILKLIQEEDVASSSSASEALLKKIGGAVNYLIQNSLDYVGKFESTGLTEAQFATLKGYAHTQPEPLKKWVLLKGQSIAGSQYSRLTGINTLPNAVGNEAFLGQIGAGGMLAYRPSRNTAHAHDIFNYIEGGPNNSGPCALSPLAGDGGNHTRRTKAPWVTSAYSMSVDGGATGYPNRIDVNIFLKINE